MANADDIFTFAKMILFGLSEPDGEEWAQREIDGFFYNEFLNPPLQLALKEARRIRMGREDPPYPCRWNETGAQDMFLPPWGNGSLYRREEPEKSYLAVSYPKERHRFDWMPDELIGDTSLLEGFAVHPSYIYNALVHGSPLPFIRVWPRWRSDPNDGPSRFQLDVYALPFGERERTWVKEVYEIFREWMYSDHPFSPKAPDLRMGANVVANFHSEGPIRLEILSFEPYASPGVFVQFVKEAAREYRSKLPGKKNLSAIPTIREWVVYLLTVDCKFSNRDAINEWNTRLGERLEHTYTMNDTEAGLRGQGVGSPGEPQFSGDKADLERRIAHYRSTLTGSLRQSC